MFGIRYALTMKPVPPGRLTISRAALADGINALPGWAQKYIHDLETRADPSGDVQELADLREQRQALFMEVEELTEQWKNRWRSHHESGQNSLAPVQSPPDAVQSERRHMDDSNAPATKGDIEELRSSMEQLRSEMNHQY